MKRAIIILTTVLQAITIYGQDIKNLSPSTINLLDFSDKRQQEFKQYKVLLEQISLGKKDMISLTVLENKLLEKYDTKEDIWEAIGGGCSWYCGGGPQKVTASSHLKSQNTNSYIADNTHDFNYKTAWVEGVAGYGVGEYLTYYFSENSPRITTVIVANGYIKSPTAYKNNSRVKTLNMYINDKLYSVLNLKDEISEQIFDVDTIGEKNEWQLKFEIAEVYKGDKYDDTVITEIYFDGIDVHCLAKGTKVLMADNSKKSIEELKTGDKVMSIDVKTKEVKTTKVESINKAIHYQLVRYKFKSGLEITSTHDHPFLTDKGWASLAPNKSRQYKGFDNIDKIEKGDQFVSLNTVEELVSIELIKSKEETYTISKLSNGNNFIANGLVVGVEETDY